MKRQTKRDPRVECVLQNIRIVLWSLAVLAIAFLSVMEAWPQEESGLTASEAFRVSSAAIDKDGTVYTTDISGTVFNPTDNTVIVDRLTVTVASRDSEEQVELSGFVLPPRTEEVIYHRLTGSEAYSRIERVETAVSGSTELLDTSGDSAVKGPVLFYLVLLLGAVFLLVRACKLRYYMWQEMQQK